MAAKAQKRKGNEEITGHEPRADNDIEREETLADEISPKKGGFMGVKPEPCSIFFLTTLFSG